MSAADCFSVIQEDTKQVRYYYVSDVEIAMLLSASICSIICSARCTAFAVEGPVERPRNMKNPGHFSTLADIQTSFALANFVTFQPVLRWRRNLSKNNGAGSRAKELLAEPGTHHRLAFADLGRSGARPSNSSPYHCVDCHFAIHELYSSSAWCMHASLTGHPDKAPKSLPRNMREKGVRFVELCASASPIAEIDMIHEIAAQHDKLDRPCQTRRTAVRDR